MTTRLLFTTVFAALISSVSFANQEATWTSGKQFVAGMAAGFSAGVIPSVVQKTPVILSPKTSESSPVSVEKGALNNVSKEKK